MATEIIIVLGILTISIILFITEWVRMDVVALLVLGALAVTGMVTPADALSGFSSPAVVTVWAVLILSGALARTGVASLIGRRLMRLAGDSEVRLMVIIMLTVGILSGFMNTIGVVSLFLPVVLDISRKKKQPPSKLLIPLAFAALLGGLNTLIGTPPNILIAEALKNANLRSFSMFEFMPVGMSVLIAGTIYMVLIGRHLLPSRDTTRELGTENGKDLKSVYELHSRMVMLNLPSDSILDGKTLAESRLGSVLGLNVVAVLRNGHTNLSPESAFTLHSGDRLLVEGRLEQLTEMQTKDHLVVDSEAFEIERLIAGDVDLHEAHITPASKLVGQTLRQIGFRQKYGVIVLAILREGTSFRTNVESIPLLVDDKLLTQARADQVDGLYETDLGLEISKPASLADYNLDDRFMIVRVPPDSYLVGKSLAESRLGDSYGLGVLGIVRSGETLLMVSPDEVLQDNDTLLVKGKENDLMLIKGLQSLQLEAQPLPDLGEIESEEIGLVETVLSPHSSLVGKTLRELNFRFKYGLSVLAVWSEGRAYRSSLRDRHLNFGDALLLYGSRRRLRLLGQEPDFLVLTEDAQVPPLKNKTLTAVIIMLMVLIPAVFGWMPIAITAIIGVALMILTKCLTMEEAYRSIEWKAIFLIAGMLPLGIAMDQTGAAQYLANGMIALIGGFGPISVMAGFFMLAALASQFMPNPAVAVLLAPIALSTAADLGVSPYPLMMTVAVSASAAFLSPVGHSANLIVMGPGGYKFSDYFKVGLPLTILTMVIVLIVVPLVWVF
ncbi:MAG TPA: SLC13 family permease [Anaerolineales bacterium]|nr:SLC13 family permease [Anaerolineales bacterium]